MNVVYSDVLELAQKEREHVTSILGGLKSRHEGYAVLLEEVEELDEELQDIKILQANMWKYIKNNVGKDAVYPQACVIISDAIKAACEAIQVAAVCMRIQDFLESEGNDHAET